jgi:hypothetical protein
MGSLARRQTIYMNKEKKNFSNNRQCILDEHSQKVVNLLFILTLNGVLPDGNDTALRHTTQITHCAQNKTQYTEVNKQ